MTPSRLSPIARAALALLLASCTLALFACGGGHHGDGDTDHKPDFDISGTWLSNMDGVHLGKFDFDMTSKGDLSGRLVTTHGTKADVKGVMSKSKAEFTLSFDDAAYLVSLVFHADHSNASGTLVDNGGRIHSMSLSK